jgi:uncharacterized protein
MVDPDNPEATLAGFADGRPFLAGGPSAWAIYWEVDDVGAAAGTVVELGGALTEPPTDTPWGRIAAVTDPMGAHFRLRQS